MWCSFSVLYLTKPFSFPEQSKSFSVVTSYQLVSGSLPLYPWRASLKDVDQYHFLLLLKYTQGSPTYFLDFDYCVCWNTICTLKFLKVVHTVFHVINPICIYLHTYLYYLCITRSYSIFYYGIYIFFKRFTGLYFMSLCECPHVCICTTCLPGAHGGQERYGTSWNWSYMWVLGTKPVSSGRVANALSFWAISLAPILYLMLY